MYACSYEAKEIEATIAINYLLEGNHLYLVFNILNASVTSTIKYLYIFCIVLCLFMKKRNAFSRFLSCFNSSDLLVKQAIKSLKYLAYRSILIHGRLMYLLFFYQSLYYICLSN